MSNKRKSLDFVMLVAPRRFTILCIEWPNI